MKFNMHDFFHKTARALSGFFSSNAKFARIAILTPTHHSLMAHIISGVATSLKKKGCFEFGIEIKNGHNKQDLIRSNAQQAAGGGYDLIISLGASCSIAVHDATILDNNPTPIIFCGFRDPVSLGIIKSFHSSGNHLTGVTVGPPPFSEQFKKIQELGIDIKHVFVPYDGRSSGLKRDVNFIENICKKNNTLLTTFDISKSDDFVGEINVFIKNADIVLTLRDNVIIQNIEKIANIAKKHKTKLCTSEWYSVDQGATMGYGFSEDVIGCAVATKAVDILVHNIHPSDIPTTTPEKTYLLRIDKKELEKCSEM